MLKIFKNRRRHLGSEVAREYLKSMGRLLEREMGIEVDFEESLVGLNLRKIVISEENRNKGYGTKIMTILCDIADSYKVDIELRAKGEKLQKWYKKFDFVVDSEGHMMRKFQDWESRH